MVWYAINIQAGAADPQAEQAPQTLSSILVATSNIEAGQILTEADVAPRQVGPDEASANALRQRGDAVGHMALTAIASNAVVKASDISGNTISGMAARIPLGYRAYAIRISESDIAGGFLQVGDHVDLYVTLPGALFATQSSAGRPDDQSKSRLLLEGIEVLAVGTKLETKGVADTTARTVTLALPADTLAAVSLATRLGNVSFAIRNPMDRRPSGVSAAELDSLVGKKPEPAPVRAARTVGQPGITIPVFSGRQRDMVRVP